MNTNNLTPRAHQVVGIAARVALRKRSSSIESVHLLFGIAHLGLGVSATVLEHQLGLRCDLIKSLIERSVEEGIEYNRNRRIDFSRDSEKMMQIAERERKMLNHGYIGVDHIFLALLSSGSSAAEMLENFGVDLEAARKEVILELEPMQRFSPV